MSFAEDNDNVENFGRVFDGTSFENVLPFLTSNNEFKSKGQRTPQQHSPLPVPPSTFAGSGKSTIFVSIPHFRDGKRCAQTLQRLFSSAADPDRIYVGLIEQTDTEHPTDDPTCLNEYCSLAGFRMKEHTAGIVHKGGKQADHDAVMESCPRAKNQIRSVRFHHLAAKGPVYARSFIRKLLGNEEFCMQIDAATDFAKGWDTLAIEQWLGTRNEYGILSTTPLSVKERDRANGSNNGSEVPRQCSVKVGSEGVPIYENHADGKAVGLTRPLLSKTHDSSFAFSKCHLETNTPHDPFAAQLLETEKFPRYARFWTRGYDVYTPSINIVYSDNTNLHPLQHVVGHGSDGEKKWPVNDNERKEAHIRMKVLLGIHHGIGSSDSSLLGGGNSIGGKISTARANLGIYGLGRRRTLKQLLDFVGISLPDKDFTGQHGNDGKGCTNIAWIPYDASISPRTNLFDDTGKADDLELPPEFPLRNLPDATGGQYDHPFPMGNAAWESVKNLHESNNSPSFDSSNVPYSLFLLLWIGGLYVWYAMFVKNSIAPSLSDKGVRTHGHAVQSKRNRMKKASMPLSERVFKNV